MSEHDSHFEAYKIAIATRNFEIDLYWKRSLFFWGFIATAALGYGSLLIEEEKNYAVLIACFGLVCSLCWSLVNRGSKYWQEHWEQTVTALEDKANVGHLFRAEDQLQNKTFWLNARKFSVSRTAIALSDFTVILWLGILGNHLLSFFSQHLYVSPQVKIIFVVVFTLAYSVILVSKAKSSSQKLADNSEKQTTYEVKVTPYRKN